MTLRRKKLKYYKDIYFKRNRTPIRLLYKKEVKKKLLTNKIIKLINTYLKIKIIIINYFKKQKIKISNSKKDKEAIKEAADNNKDNNKGVKKRAIGGAIKDILIFFIKISLFTRKGLFTDFIIAYISSGSKYLVYLLI
ncbi:hypothetical protein B0T21DRAFT_347590 [Apiosordaria backusii]|uniref:Uncharacterized protein n=1 Tax=Apiosordaria backusii TaxID=314023 RepID=A0AA40BN61_9PEZI|nr:hypothetical protein B0T21DRAFT_347590 [Apiosordaria backusii]